MNDISPSLKAFHLTGEKHATGLENMGTMKLRPALFGGYRDLAKLRYDFPVVLIGGATSGQFMLSLKDIINGLLQDIATEGALGERLRLQVLGLEQNLRTLVSEGRKGTLQKLWDAAERKLISKTVKAERDSLKKNLALARAALAYDGEVVGFDEALPARIMTHTWAISQQAKQKSLRLKMERLTRKLSEILQVDFMHSDKARTPDKLRKSVGLSGEDAFDFDAMAKVLNFPAAAAPLPLRRGKRIRAALEILETRLKDMNTGAAAATAAAKDFVFPTCAAALKAYRERLPGIVQLVRAIAIAELEIDNRYREPRHDPFFDTFSEKSLGPDDAAMFPAYLICMTGGVKTASEHKALFEILSSELPFKILVQSDDILDRHAAVPGQSLSGLNVTHLANMALGLDDAFIVQTPASGLYQLRHLILRGMANQIPALFTVFSGAMKTPDKVAPYLIAAAAMESRALPSYCYDPLAKGPLAARFSLAGNPGAEGDWPVHDLSFEDSECQKSAATTAFTFADFAAIDERYADLLAPVPSSAWHDDMIPLADFIALDESETAIKVPYIWVIDENDNLYRAVVEDHLVDMTRRCLNHWKLLRERAEPPATEKAAQPEAPEAPPPAEPQPAAKKVPAPAETEKAAPAAQPEPAAPAAEVAPGEPYIDTPRCTTCNECTGINNKMFAYNEDMQAYIADPDAGTYRQLVEAAESCQVCIIHPGLPRDQSEPGLEDLIKRAEAFN